MNINRAISDCINELISARDLRKATKYLSPACVIKATRHNRADARDRSETFVVTYGKPNYAEREFVKKCKKVREPFPIKRIQYTFWPAKRKKAA